jgi:general secretion pathway protein D
MNMKPTIWMVFFIAAALLAGCAAQRKMEEGQELIAAGQYEEGLARLDEAQKLEPSDQTFRTGYIRSRDNAVQRLLAQAETARQQSRWDEAEKIYQRVLGIDAANPRAKQGIDSLSILKRQRTLLKDAEAKLKANQPMAAEALVREVLREAPQLREAQALMRRIEEKSARESPAGPALKAGIRNPITLEFRDASIRQVFDILSQNAGINVIFDKDVKPDLKTTILVRDKTIEDVIRYILVTNQLSQKTLDEDTLLIYPNVADKKKEYQDLVFRTFYIGNADAKVTANLIKTVVKPKELFHDEKLNLIVIRDTPEAVRMAERLIANQDLAEPEVVLEVEVLEVGTDLLTEIGLRWPDQVSYSTMGSAGTAGVLTLPELLKRNSGLVRVTLTDPLIIATLRGTDSKASILANPRIRVKNREKAKIHVGDKVPVFTATTTATGIITESTNFLDVGLKLDVEPTVHVDDEVNIRIGLEVSSIVREIRSPLGSLTYRVGSRSASTVLRLKDGETQVLAGLINDEERKSVSKVPGLGDIPLIGRLFSSHKDTAVKTEIVLLITPRVVRTLPRPGLREEEFLSGTEAAMGAAPLAFRQSQSAEDGEPKAKPAGTAARPLPPGAKGTILTGVGLLAEKAGQIGNEFVVSVEFATPSSVRSALLDLAFEPARFQVVKVEEGDLLKQTGASLKHTVEEGKGRLSLNLASTADLPGRGQVAKITFKLAGEPGPALMRIDGLTLIDGTGKVIPVSLPPPHSVTLLR